VRQAPSARVGLARLAGVVDPGALPTAIREPIARELEAARAAACEPLEAAAVKRVASAFDDFDPDPIAIRAAAQTHRGTVDGVPVAIRIRRPGLERSVRNDLALLDTLAPALRAALPRADAGALLRSAREQLLDELDFEHEASMQRRVARALRGIDGLVVPAVHSDLCAEDVLVAELLDGETLADGARPSDPAAAARTLVAAHVAAARAGFALVDARPGHVVVLADGRIGLLGVGMARPVGRDRVGRAFDALAALRGADESSFPGTAAEYAVARSALGPLVEGEARLDATALRCALRRALPALELAPQVEPQADDLWLARAAGQLVATLARLEASADWPALVASS